MDFLQIALILLIVILGIFLSITGLQVFYILRDLKRALNKLNKVLYNEEEKVASLRVKSGQVKKTPTPPKRFFKRG